MLRFYAKQFFKLAVVSALGGMVKVHAVEFHPIVMATLNQGGGQAVSWADVNGDEQLDFVIGFRGKPLQLYLQTADGFVERSAQLGIKTGPADYRSLAWGDYNSDGYADLFVGFGRDSGLHNRVYQGRSDGFVEVAEKLGLDSLGTTRQASWIDYDNDGDSDLFVAMRDRTSKLFRNDGATFVDVSARSGLADPRRSVASVWFDYDYDGDLDLYLPNQSGDRDGLYKNDAGHFVDVAAQLNIDRPQRPLKEGSVGATLCDVNNDGHLDIFVPVYGKDMLYIADGKGAFIESAAAWGVDADALAVSADCGDFDNDGRMDLYLVAYSKGEAHGDDRLYHNRGDHFVDVFPKGLKKHDGDHGVRFADFDDDGDLDIAISNRHPLGRSTIWENSGNSNAYLKVWVKDSERKFTRQGSEVRIYDSGSKTLIASGIVDTGGGYVSQTMQPLHFGLGQQRLVDVEVTFMSPEGRKVTRLEAQQPNKTVEVLVGP